MKRKREELPIPCDYDLSAFETTEDIAEQLVQFEEANPSVGVYIFEWHEHRSGGELQTAFPHLVRTPSKLCKDEVLLLLYQEHFMLITNYQALMGEQGRRGVGRGQRKKERKYCHRCSWSTCLQGAKGKEALQEHLEECDPWALERPEVCRGISLPARKNGLAPTIRFTKHIAKVDVPCYVVFDMECYSLGYSQRGGPELRLRGRRERRLRRPQRVPATSSS
jgi:hypothetical protein